ncbi:hypothetical protein DIPPA_04136 [Diplonema papillatum]|nr:hypothetical protein DIPPA_04136 [Diplonema papillatum]
MTRRPGDAALGMDILITTSITRITTTRTSGSFGSEAMTFFIRGPSPQAEGSEAFLNWAACDVGYCW